MQRVLIYDPHRAPRHWVELLRPGQFAVFLLDVRTSVIVDLDGAAVTDSLAQSCFIFDTLTESKRFCEELVARIDHARCEIYDERGKSVEPLYTIVNRRFQHRIVNRPQARLLMLGAALVVLLSIPLFWYDWRADGARIWPTIIGINVVALGLRLLYWGYGELEQLRRQEAEQALAEEKSRASMKERA